MDIAIAHFSAFHDLLFIFKRHILYLKFFSGAVSDSNTDGFGDRRQYIRVGIAMVCR
jgi:hypothetical protein